MSDITTIDTEESLEEEFLYLGFRPGNTYIFYSISQYTYI